ncbi:hypothetical protein C8J57DRAFT_1507015 [Mycena rebaudengoi]|nr:hypothetical protein C8J57DRAFT_1507015 [Mycena rebaudengoi]
MPPPSHRESTRSWWSDRNQPGATIDLLALAKPLSRLLYHRQALAFMEQAAVSPLTVDELQLVLTYLWGGDA